MKCGLTFKGPLCGYDGDAERCDKTLARCRELGNEYVWWTRTYCGDIDLSGELERVIRCDLTDAGFPTGPEAFERCVKAMHRLALELMRSQ